MLTIESPRPARPVRPVRPVRHLAINAASIALIRPCDERAHDALRQLGDIAGVRVLRGSVTLGDGETHPALLAITAAGAVLVAALLNDAGTGTSEGL